jgi:hypothetical protein
MKKKLSQKTSRKTDMKDRRRASEDRKTAAALLVDGLKRLADRWHPNRGGHRLRTFRPADSVPIASRQDSIPRGHVVHASRARIDHSGGVD